jgi:protein-tyrosine-phosphatase
MPNILFVCSANMCRSPIAEALFRHLIELGKVNSDWEAASAGIWAFDGNRAAEGVVRAMQRRGINIRAHRAQSIRSELVKGSDLILTMEGNHKEALQAAFPKYKDRIYLLTEMVGLSHDIRDPIGGSAADYDDTVDELERLLVDGLGQINALVENTDGEWRE